MLEGIVNATIKDLWMPDAFQNISCHQTAIFILALVEKKAKTVKYKCIRGS